MECSWPSGPVSGRNENPPRPSLLGCWNVEPRRGPAGFGANRFEAGPQLYPQELGIIRNLDGNNLSLDTKLNRTKFKTNVDNVH